MEKINIAEILEGCPRGMELDCSMFDGLEFDRIDKYNNPEYPIVCRVKTQSDRYNFHTFTEYGGYTKESYSKCVIFPKGKTIWEGFVPPCKFKDGDVVYVECKHDDFIFIYKGLNEYLRCFVCISSEDFYNGDEDRVCRKDRIQEIRLATEEEKEKLFKAIKENGYRWNAETKTLEKLPKFKVGDKIKKKGLNTNHVIEITSIEQTMYMFWGGDFQYIEYVDRDYELVSNKFNISTLEPFDKVLVRNANGQVWTANFFSHVIDTNPELPITFVCVGGSCPNQCIPFKGNEHLRGKSDDCSDFYKTW